jgi:hypothetical protein
MAQSVRGRVNSGISAAEVRVSHLLTPAAAALYTASNRDPKHMTQVASWIVAASIVAALAWVLARTVRLRVVPTSALMALAAAACFAGLYMYSTYMPSKEVILVVESPTIGAQVASDVVRISGSVDPPGAAVTVMVRSETDERWWIQDPATRAEDGTGRWTIEAHLGTKTEGLGRDGRGETFNVIAIGSADSSLFNLLTGRTLTAGPYETTPRWAQSSPLIVRRIP